MRDFKFFKDNNKERVFTDYMDMMDDYHLGGIPQQIGGITTQPAYPNVPEGYEFIGGTPTYYERMTLNQSKYVLIRNRNTQDIVKHCKIYPGDPLWNYNVEIVPDIDPNL